MRKKAHEFNGTPTEFRKDGAPEFPALPDEFNRFIKPRKKTEDKRSRRLRRMLIFAAAGLITIGLFRPVPAAAQPGEAEGTAPVQTALPSEHSEPTTLPTAKPTLVPTPEPTPEPIPGAEAVFIRSSLVYFGTVRFSVPDRITEAGMRIWDPEFGVTATEHTFTREEIDSGVFTIARYDANGFCMEHSDVYGQVDREPRLTLETTVTYRTETGEETLTENTAAEAVPWVNVNYDTEEDIGGVIEWMYGTVYPNHFVVRIEEVPTDHPRVIFGDDVSMLGNGDTLVTITVDGTMLAGEFDPVDGFGYIYDGEKYYNFVFAVPLPDSFPTHGTACVAIKQKLVDHDFIFEKEPFDITY